LEFDKIKAEVKKIEQEMTRIDNDNYFEAVIADVRLEGLVAVLEGIFGAPVWPSDRKLPKDTEKLIKDAGGLKKGQTLYLLNNESGCSAFAMLWPWQNGERITVKISLIPKGGI